MITSKCRLYVVAALLLYVCTPLHSQTTATMLGKVFDPTGAAVPVARVVVKNIGTGLTRALQTDANGEYLVPALPPGTYSLTVTAPGFKMLSHSDIILDVAQNARVDAHLQLGDVTQELSVSASALQVDSQSSSVGTVVDNRRIITLPLNGRNVLSLALLVPGMGGASTLPVTVTDQRSGPLIVTAGTRTNESAVMLDGVLMTSGMYNVAQNLPAPDALEEFRVLTNTYSADYGIASGGVFLAVTKSGTNSLHGSLWEFLRNDALNARNEFAVLTPSLRQNQFGARLGGPVRRNRTFFFGSYEGIRIRQATQVVMYPPTSAQRQGDLSSIKTAIKDPTSGTPFPGNQIPVSRFDPVAINILQLYIPLPNQSNGASNTWDTIPTSGNQFSLKGDHRLSDSDSLTARFYRNDTTSLAFGGNISAFAAPQSNLVQTTSLAETHLFSPNVVGEVRAGISDVQTIQRLSPINKSPQQLGANYSQDVSTTNCPEPGFCSNPMSPTVTVSGLFSMTPSYPKIERSRVYQADGKISWVKGSHNVRFGFLAMYESFLLQSQFRASGVITFDGSFSGNALADFLLGRPVTMTQRGMSSMLVRSPAYIPFVQDDVKVSRRLTLNFGARYDLMLPQTVQGNTVGDVQFGKQSQRFPSAPPGLVYPGDPGVPDGLVNTEWLHVAPRFGFAWDLRGDGRTAVRGGYGIFWAPQPACTMSNGTLAPPFVQDISLSPPHSLSDPYAGTNLASVFPYTLNLKNPVFAYPMGAWAVDPHFGLGYSQQFNLNVQQQIGQDWVIQAGYFATLGRKLTSGREANAAVFGPGATASNTQQRRPYFPQYFAQITMAHSDINSEFNSLQISAQKRFSHSFTLQLAYTYSKSIDEQSTYSTDSASAQNPANYLEGERGLSSFDQRHILRINGVWELPTLQNQGWIRHVAGSWRLSGIVSVLSGTPFSVTSGSDRALLGATKVLGAQRGNVIGDGPLDPSRSRSALIQEYFNTAAFAVPALGTFGNSGRNNLIGPGSFNTDLAILKRFSPWRSERAGAFEFRAEAFNVFNFVNLGQPVSALNSPVFGQINSAGPARIFQFGLRYDF